ncbi:MAG: dihydroorotate dehydrogenase-like protein [Vicinamibacterales bacterium]
MDLSTTYLGLRLANPFMTGASPMTDHLDWVRRLEDAGAGAIVLRSLFEEQITHEQEGIVHHMEARAYAHPEALSYFPRADDFAFGPVQYLEQLRRVKNAVKIPVIGSLNGTTPEGWLGYAKQIEQAGADALELNVYFLATDPAVGADAIEHRVLEIVRIAKKEVSIPVAVKLSPFFSSLAHFARQLDHTGADGLVLFNRFYQPDIDIEALEAQPVLHLSDSSELPLRLRWLAILSGHLKASLAVSGGIHTATDAIKAVMAGASAVQAVSALIKNGPDHIGAMRDGMAQWMEQHEYVSLEQMRGSMNLMRSPDPGAFERANYMKVLQSLKVSKLPV